MMNNPPAGWRTAIIVVALAGLPRGGTVEHRGNPSSLDDELERALVRASGGVGVDFYALPASDDYASIPQDPRNPITNAKVQLGQLLFHETALALDAEMPQGIGTYSCSSCHHAGAGFQAGIRQGIGEGGVGFGSAGEGRGRDPNYPLRLVDVQPIRTPTILNVAYQENLGWNGQFGATGLNVNTKYAWMPGPRAFNRFGFQGTETQAIAAADVHRLSVEGLMEQYPEYRELFDRAFPNVPEPRRYAIRYAGLAIGAYERTIFPNQAPFQQWLRGHKEALSEEEKQGAIVFFGKAGCVTCHNGPALNSMQFAAMGMNNLFQSGHDDVLLVGADSLENQGRGGFTRRMEDMYAFKVPQLYNLSDARFYGHGASFSTIRDVVAYMNQAEPENMRIPRNRLSPAFRPLRLTESEIDAITAFLTRSLRDADLERYVPSLLPSNACFPNNDSQSKRDLGCERN